MSIEITCPCGEVVVSVRGAPAASFYCHCDDCQAVHGAAYVPIVMYPVDAVEVVRGATLEWARKVTPRVSCARCGARLFAKNPFVPMRGVTASLLPADVFVPTFHLQCQFARLPVDDALPHFKSIPAAFGGSDETVDW